jgi:hypothetical protein
MIRLHNWKLIVVDDLDYDLENAPGLRCLVGEAPEPLTPIHWIVCDYERPA